MITKRFVLSVLVFVVVVLLNSSVSAHELWIQATKEAGRQELKVEVIWGHFGNFLDRASYEDYQLYVRYPGGSVKELKLERAGVIARTYLIPQERGEYVFWVLRNPGIYTPGDGIPTLSVQMAKSVYHFGTGPGTAGEPVDIPLEIVPAMNLSGFKVGTIKGIVLLDGKPAGEAIISAHGPGNRDLKGEAGTGGDFELNLDIPGTWLIKASIKVEEDGKHGDDSYSRVSRTTTLVIDTENHGTVAVASTRQVTPGTFPVMMAISFIIGLMLGGAGAFFVARKSA
ncbi:MAG: DUF4198 domain-containing protein [Candidatus Loosdrechtia sp.]|uniref:DUF4198 domain-containing protein n=1 Tax=Candidatus Loosdrechtia sp. TaxID=3101272 RepID=UPI003A6B2F23|nr:MAG: DUF4198 domain-containing protein [Candidatus Jettenia sp. AMX2]